MMEFIRNISPGEVIWAAATFALGLWALFNPAGALVADMDESKHRKTNIALAVVVIAILIAGLAYAWALQQ